MSRDGDIEDILRSELVHPFPYADCRRILADVNDPRCAMLIPDLDLYFSTVVSRAQTARKIVGWPPEKRLSVQRELDASFFEKHPAYGPLQERISSTATPALHDRLRLCDRLRRELLELLAELATEPSPGKS
jgi:hypothetical protein